MPTLGRGRAPLTSPKDGVIGLYERHAAAFETQRSRVYFERPWIDRFTQDLAPGSKIVDLGCGLGRPLAEALLEAGFHVVGVDGAPAMIERCRARFPGAEWIVADMRALALGRQFDGILAWHSFFHLGAEDQRAMFPRFRDHASPGARLMFTSGPEAGTALGVFEGEILHHASLDPHEYEALLHDNGFTVTAQRSEDASCGGATVWLARRTDRQTPTA